MNKSTMTTSRALRPWIAAIVTGVVLTAALIPNTSEAGPRKHWAEGRILVQPRAGLDDAQFQQILSQNGRGRALRRLNKLGVHVIKVPAGTEDEAIAALSSNPHIKSAEKDMLLEPQQVIPNDPQYPAAWHLPKIQAPQAWDNTGGAGIKVAILDTGVDSSHPDLKGQVLPGWNTVSNNTDTADIYGHGTQVAGVVAALTNNGIGVASIAGQTKLLPVRVSNDSASGTAFTSDIVEAITWAVDNGALVANVSFAVGTSTTAAAAAQYMRNHGGIVVVAAGNSSRELTYADMSSEITVAATDDSDQKAGWSNYGNPIDIAAPGVGIWSTTRGGGYAAVSGTSFASPATAAVVALIMAENYWLSPTEVEAVLESSADDPIPGTDWHSYFGNGRINAAKAVLLAAQTAPFDPDPPVVAIFKPKPTILTTVRGLITVEVNASDAKGVTEVALYANGQLVGRDTLAPYQFSWDTSKVPVGAVALTAKAWDPAGNEGLSARARVNVSR